MIVTLPTWLGLKDWADQIVFDLNQYGSFGKLGNEDKWQDWAAQFLSTDSVGRSIPSPYDFDDWKDWAERFCQAVQ